MKEVRNRQLRDKLNKLGIKDIVIEFSEGSAVVYSDDDYTNNIFYYTDHCVPVTKAFYDYSIDEWVEIIKDMYNDGLDRYNRSSSKTPGIIKIKSSPDYHDYDHEYQDIHEEDIDDWLNIPKQEYRVGNKAILKAEGDSATRTVTEILDPSCQLKVGDSVNDFSSNKDYLDDVYNGNFVITSTKSKENNMIKSSKQIKSVYTREDYDRFDEYGNFIPYKPTAEELAKKDEIKKVLDKELAAAFEPDPMDDYAGYDSTSERMDAACERVAKQFNVDTDFVDQIAGEIQNESNEMNFKEWEWANTPGNLTSEQYDKWYRGEFDVRPLMLKNSRQRRNNMKDDIVLSGLDMNKSSLNSVYRKNRYNDPDFNNDRIIFKHEDDYAYQEEDNEFYTGYDEYGNYYKYPKDIPFDEVPGGYPLEDPEDDEDRHYRDMGEMYGTGIRPANSSRKPIKSSADLYDFTYEDEDEFDRHAFYAVEKDGHFEVTDTDPEYKEVRIGDIITADDAEDMGLEWTEVLTSSHKPIKSTCLIKANLTATKVDKARKYYQDQANDYYEAEEYKKSDECDAIGQFLWYLKTYLSAKSHKDFEQESSMEEILYDIYTDPGALIEYLEISNDSSINIPASQPGFLEKLTKDNDLQVDGPFKEIYDDFVSIEFPKIKKHMLKSSRKPIKSYHVVKGPGVYFIEHEPGESFELNEKRKARCRSLVKRGITGEELDDELEKLVPSSADGDTSQFIKKACYDYIDELKGNITSSRKPIKSSNRSVMIYIRDPKTNKWASQAWCDPYQKDSYYYDRAEIIDNPGGYDNRERVIYWGDDINDAVAFSTPEKAKEYPLKGELYTAEDAPLFGVKLDTIQPLNNSRKLIKSGKKSVTRKQIEDELDRVLENKRISLNDDVYKETVDYILSFWDDDFDDPKDVEEAVHEWYLDTKKNFPDVFTRGHKQRVASSLYLRYIKSNRR